MKFIFGVSAEDTELIDGLEEGADIVSRLSKKTKITPDIWYTIIFLALTAGSYYGVEYLNDKFKDVKGVEKTNLDSILEKVEQQHAVENHVLMMQINKVNQVCHQVNQELCLEVCHNQVCHNQVCHQVCKYINK